MPYDIFKRQTIVTQMFHFFKWRTAFKIRQWLSNTESFERDDNDKCSDGKWSPSVFSILSTGSDLQICFNHLWQRTIALVMQFAVHVEIYFPVSE